MRIKVETQVSDIKEFKDDALTQWVGEVSAKLAMMPSEHEELRAKMKVLQETLNTIVTEQKNYRQNQQNYQKQIVQLRSQIATANQGEIEDLSNKIKSLEAMLADLKTPTAAFSELNIQLMALQQEHSALKTSSELLIKSNAKLRTQLNGVIEDSERQAQQYMAWQQELTRRATELEEIQKANVSDLQIQLSQTKTALSKRWAELGGLGVWRDQLQKQIAELKPGNEELREKLMLMQVSLQKILDDQVKQQFQHAGCQKQIALLRQQIEATQDAKNIAPLEDKIKNLESELALLKNHPNGAEVIAHLSALQNEFLLVKKSAEQVSKVNSNLRSQLQSVIEENTRQSQLVSGWQEEFSQQLKQAAEHQDTALNELQAQLSQSKMALTKKLVALDGRVISLEDKQADLEIKHQVLATKTDPDITTAKKLLLLRQAVLNNKQIDAELAYYIAPNGQVEISSSDVSPLQAWIENEFLQGEKRVLLLHGGAGAGKTTFNRYLERELWQSKEWDSLIPGKTVPKCMVPIFIPLGSSRVATNKLFDYLHNLPELREGFTDAEINVLKRDYKILLIADGYDEIPSKNPVNLYDKNELQQYDGRVKLLIGCRTQRALELSEEEWFVPHLEDKSSQRCYYHRMISPFNDKQIADYIERYLKNKQVEKDRGITDILLWPDASTYQRQIEKLPDLRVLIDTPFLLMIAMEVLPKIVAEVEKESKATKESKSSIGAIDLTKMKLYDEFVAQWFERQKEKARKAGLLPAKKDIMSYYQEFCQKFAECLLKTGGTTVQFPYEEDRLFPKTKDSWIEDLFDDKSSMVTLARQGSPLTTTVDNYHGFIHASLIDYFSMRRIVQDYKSKLVKQKEQVSSKVIPILETKEITPKPEDEVILPAVSASSAEALLNLGKLTYDQIHFLVDHSQQDTHFKDYLFHLIQRSKKESVLAQGAANAITVLNAAEVSFSGMDFNGICIPGADLRGALFDNTQLQGADLTGVNLQQAWMRGANLTGAKMEGVNFGEFPNLEGNVFCQSLDGSLLAAAWSDKSEVYIYDSKTLNLISKLISVGEIKSMAFSVDNQYLTVVSGIIPNRSVMLDDYNCYKVFVQSWELKNKKVKWQSNYSIAGGAFMSFAAIKFSPDGKHLALAASWKDQGCYDGSISLMILETDCGKTIATQPLKKYQVKGDVIEKSAFLKFSSDGKYLAAIGSKGIILFALNKGIKIFEDEELVCEICTFSPKGNQMAVVSKSIELWDIDIHQKIHRKKLTNTLANICSVIFSNDGCLLSVGDMEGNILIYKSDKKEIIRNLKAEKDIRCMTFSPDGQSIATGHQSGSIFVWNIGSGASREFNGNYAPAELIYSQSGNYLFSRPDNKYVSQEKIHVWNTSMGVSRKLKKQLGHKKAISDMQISDDGQQIITLSWMDSRLCIWNTETGGKQLFKLRKGSLTLSTGNKRLLVAGTSQIQHSDPGDIIVWIQDLKGTLKHEFRGYWPNHLQFSPDGRWLAWTERSRDGKNNFVILVDTEKWQRQQIVSDDHYANNLFLYYGDDSVRLIVDILCASQNVIISYNLPMNKEEVVLSTEKLDGFQGWKGGIRRFRSYQNYLVSWPMGADNLILIDLNTKSSRKLTAQKGVKLTQCKFSANGKLIASGTEDGKVFIWDLTKEVDIGKELKTDALSIAKNIGIEEFSSDGKWLITRAVDPVLNVVIIGVWDISAGRCIGTIPIKHASSIVRYENVSYRSTESSEYYFADVIGTSVRYWKIQITPSNIKASLLWCNEHPFFPFDAIITDAKMSSINACLLRQYGAKGKPAEIIPSEIREEKTDALKKDSLGIRGLAAPATRFGLLATKETPPTPANSPVTSPAKTTSPPHAKASTSVSKAPAKLTFS